MTTLLESVSVEAVFREAALARPRVARLGSPTPVHRVDGPAGPILLKREDLSIIHSFKWRGAANKIGHLAERGLDRQIVAASAGNHAQGVALAAAEYGLKATIFMPRSTPRIKLADVRRFGGSWVTVELVGDNFDDAAVAARDFALRHKVEFVHAYDDLHVIAGQATIGDEIVHAGERPERVYLPIGGGGLAAGIGCILRAHWPDVELVGVEAVGQASMSAAMDTGNPIDIGPADPFCDGTAIRRAGYHTLSICRTVIDRVTTVSNDEVCAAMEFVWTALRTIPEPSGALGVAAILREQREVPGQYMAVLTGSNVDFMTMPRIAARSHIGQRVRRAYRFVIEERAGSLVELLEQLGDECNIVEFQYGKTDEHDARPIIAYEAMGDHLDRLAKRIDTLGFTAEDVTGEQTVDFRAIPVRPDLFQLPLFTTIAFPDRRGALHEFMHRISNIASICYFNFMSTGETDGRALMGFEFLCAEDRNRFERVLADSGMAIELFAAGTCPIA